MTGVMLLRGDPLRNGLRQSGANSRPPLNAETLSAPGAVRPIYNRQKAMTLTVSCDSGVTECWQIIGHPTGIGWAYHTTTTYYHGDHLGSSRFLSSYNGTPMWEATYLPYGQEHVPAGGSLPLSPAGQHYKFTGKERDPESGLDYFGARYYSSAHGRFLSADEFTGGPMDAFSASDPLPPGPLPYADITNPQLLNKYGYGCNNPLTYIDADGHFPWLAVVVAVAVTYAVYESVQAFRRFDKKAEEAKQKRQAALDAATKGEHEGLDDKIKESKEATEEALQSGAEAGIKATTTVWRALGAASGAGPGLSIPNTVMNPTINQAQEERDRTRKEAEEKKRKEEEERKRKEEEEKSKKKKVD
jgi:RHS repeat-associated protein